MQAKEFDGRVALVTGGSRGIGRAVSLALAREGAKVAINYVAGAAAAREVEQLATAAGSDAVAVQGDVSDPDQVEAMVAAVEGKLGPIDHLVCSAGIVKHVGHAETHFADWRRIMAVNVDGTFLATMAVKDGMLARGRGSIVCIGSIAGLRPRAISIAYSTSKAALIGFVRSTAAALAPAVWVNCVAPGLTETEMADLIEPDRRAEMIASTPLKRIGQPEEIAELVQFLLSDRASYITGQTMVACGGRVMVP